jgi:nucleotidyltransferase/DNA polymerase involved in DNA repair
VTIKVRYDDFTTVTRSATIAPTQDADVIAAQAAGLAGRTEAGTRPVRLLGVGVHNLCGLEDVPPPERPLEMPWLPFEE